MRLSLAVGTGILAVCLFLITAWFVHYTLSVKTTDVHFVETEIPHAKRPFQPETPVADQLLTEEMAIKYTRQELVNKGHDVSVLKPVEYWYDYPEGFAERVFARNRIRGKENEGYVLWGPKDPGELLWIYKVSIVNCTF